MKPTIPTDQHSRFVATPAAVLDRPGYRIVWPVGGQPAAFDLAAATMLRCFATPLLPGELADDLSVALGTGRPTAAQTVAGMIAALLGSGHLIPEGTDVSRVPMYPLAASP